MAMAIDNKDTGGYVDEPTGSTEEPEDVGGGDSTTTTGAVEGQTVPAQPGEVVTRDHSDPASAVDSWVEFAETHGWEDLKQKIKDGAIPDEVLKDPRFAIAMQEAKDGYEARFALLSGIIKSENDVRMSIIRNTFA